MAKAGSDPSPPMPGMVWVGKVKSDAPPSVLERAFEQFGPIKAVETGFAGFAFVRFLEDGDADQAVRSMHDQLVPGVGKVLAQKATQRGYQDALNKREAFRRSGLLGARRPGPGPRGPQGDRAVRHDRRPSPVRPAETWRRSDPGRTAARGPRGNSVTLAEAPVPRFSRVARGTRNARACSRSRSRSGQRSRSEGPSERGSLPEDDRRLDEARPSTLGRTTRHQVLCFFDGATVLDLLLEAQSGSAEYPFSFDGLSQEDACESLAVAADFAQPGYQP
ncbi:unnamed protein product [Effrenium voratum]|nr:unnamed protein product [Effrenium voratum]